ncbi:MAG: type II toxin-antitoxin system VapC family toxin [candidate division WS1 bacterium]|nr:type II toxin-antitoxin system VapC family toxin [candidate division WS1 bacterium]
MRPVYVLDTNAFIDLLAQREDVTEGLDRATEDDALMLLCPFVYYEMERGFRKLQQTENEQRFLFLSRIMQWQDLELSDRNLAAQFWARNEGIGRRKSDADLVIAAFARNRNASVVTADVCGFESLPVMIENWRVEG